MPLQKEKIDLHDKGNAVEFYQERYANGYIDEWPAERKQRIFEVIRSLELPSTGEALDFGCGNGVLTDVLRQALPSGWNVYGSDISANAIANASERYPECTFLVAGDRNFTYKKFDFLFSHHVLEHVYDLPQILDEIDACLKEESSILHILPCGNEGSLEHDICLLRQDGVDRSIENRFFFEEEGHIRRLDTAQLSGLCAAKGFSLAKEYYSHQYHACIDWFTRSWPSFILQLTDPAYAVSPEAQKSLRQWRYKLFLLWTLRIPAVVVDQSLSKRKKTPRNYLLLVLGLPLYLFSKPADTYLKRKALEEWDRRKTDRAGSEMYLFFKRPAKVN
ncbi:class I SAM-dependent methyltransferase [Altericista sp. CCNU0014]|uniref:class I SAM-dependent methyltransferase n=1 Tax=Altericista sp. CCNU0014 TaxID=3082949 RepID=UPI00384EA3FF